MDIVVVELDARLERNWAARLTKELPSMQLSFLTLADVEDGTYKRLHTDIALIVTAKLTRAHLDIGRRIHPIPVTFLVEDIGDIHPDELPASEVTLHVVQSNHNELTYRTLLLSLRMAGRSDIYAQMTLRTLLDNLDAGVCFEDRHGTLQHVNERVALLFDLNLAPSERTGLPARELLNVFADQMVRPDDFLLRCAELRQQGFAERNEWPLRDGRVLVVSYAPVFSAGEFAGHLWQFLDISAQKRMLHEVQESMAALAQSEEEQRQLSSALWISNQELEARNQQVLEQSQNLRAIIANAPLALFAVDLDGQVLLIDDKAVSKPSHGTRGTRNSLELLASLSDWQPDFARALNGEAFSVVRSGRRRTFEVHYGPMFSATGERQGAIGVAVDVTERVEAEAAMADARRKSEEATQAKERFLATVSHEIRTPLNGIIGLTHLLRRTALTPEQQEFVTALQQSGDHLLALINDILDLSRIRSGKLVVERIPFLLPELLQRLQADHEHRAQEKRLGLVFQLDPAVPAYLLGDPTRIRQILNNLLTNALKFTEQGEIRVRVDAASRMGDHVRLRFAVSDTGIGIAPEHLSSIFDSFTQAAAETNRLFGGTGLGLSIVRELAQVMEGNITVESVLGQGSTFLVELPLGLPLDTSPEPMRSIHDQPQLQGHVLLVEDHPVNQMIASRMLGSWGVQVTLAETGNKAWAMLTGQPYDLVLMDLRLPEVDGLTLSERLRATPGPNQLTPVIAVTAQLLADERDKCLAVGMNAFLTKPFNPVDFYRLVQTWLPHPGEAIERPTAAERMVPPVHLDLNVMRKFVGGDQAMVDELLAMSHSTLGTDMAALARAEEPKEISGLAHRLKTTLKHLGDGPGALLLEQLEGNPQPGTQAGSLQARALAHLEGVRLTLAQHLPAPQSALAQSNGKAGSAAQ